MYILTALINALEEKFQESAEADSLLWDDSILGIYIDKPGLNYYNITVSEKCVFLWKEEELLYYIVVSNYAYHRLIGWQFRKPMRLHVSEYSRSSYIIDEKGTDL